MKKMKGFINSKSIIYLYLINFINNLSFCKQTYFTYTLEINRERSDIEIMNIKLNDKICPVLIPSLYSTFAIVPSDRYIAGFKELEWEFDFYYPFLDEYFTVQLYLYSFLNFKDICLGKIKFFPIINNCLLGLSYGIDSNKDIEKFALLNQLYNTSQIKEPIFSLING